MILRALKTPKVNGVGRIRHTLKRGIFPPIGIFMGFPLGEGNDERYLGKNRGCG